MTSKTSGDRSTFATGGTIRRIGSRNGRVSMLSTGAIGARGFTHEMAAPMMTTNIMR